MNDLDLHDSELIEDTLRSPGYALIAGRIQKAVDRDLGELVTNRHEPDLMNEIRGRIIGMRLALQIPKHIAEESRGKSPKK